MIRQRPLAAAAPWRSMVPNERHFLCLRLRFLGGSALGANYQRNALVLGIGGAAFARDHRSFTDLAGNSAINASSTHSHARGASPASGWNTALPKSGRPRSSMTIVVRLPAFEFRYRNADRLRLGRVANQSGHQLPLWLAPLTPAARAGLIARGERVRTDDCAAWTAPH